METQKNVQSGNKKTQHSQIEHISRLSMTEPVGEKKNHTYVFSGYVFPRVCFFLVLGPTLRAQFVPFLRNDLRRTCTICALIVRYVKLLLHAVGHAP